MGQIVSNILESVSSNDQTDHFQRNQPYSSTVVLEERGRVLSRTTAEAIKLQIENERRELEERLLRLRLEETRKRRVESLQKLRLQKEFEEEVKKRELLKKERWIKHYCSSQKILLVGEGDFSFSACLAKAFASATNMVATSLDSIEFLGRNYRSAVSNINELRSRGCRVIHEIDATVMASHPCFMHLKFDRIIYNFPLAGFFLNEPRADQIRHNQKLVKLFFMNAKQMISENGEIHITHKSNGFYQDWNLETLASSSGLELIEEVNFTLSDYPGYNNKYGFGGDRNFNCNPSKTYKFALITSRAGSLRKNVYNVSQILYGWE